MTRKNKYAKGVKLSERKFRELIKLFSVDLDSSQIAKVTGLNRSTVNRYLNAIRFCGADEFDDKETCFGISSTYKCHFAVLCRCGAAGPMRDSEKRAIAAWNTRNDSERQSIEYSFNFSETNDPPALRGNLKSLDFPVILQILSSANKTGVLHLNQGQEARKIYFRDGKIVAANGREPLRLGQIGCGKGIISQEQLQSALVEVKKTERQMGEVPLAFK